MKKRHLTGVKRYQCNPDTLIVVFTCFWMIVSGCALPPAAPELPEDLPVRWSSTVGVQDLPITSSLLDLLDDHRAIRLVAEAQANNPNLKATALRLKAAGHLLSGQRSRAMPAIHAEVSKSRDNQSFEAETGEMTTADSHRLTIGIGWELDIWGRLANEHAAAHYDLKSQEQAYMIARDSLAARVVQAWIELTAARLSVELESEQLSVLRTIEEVNLQRYASGIGSLDEFSVAKTGTAIATANLSVRKATYFQVARQLELLLGRYPTGEMSADNGLPKIEPPPVSLPAVALMNRPDVQMSFQRIMSARHQSHAADKAVLPDLRLSGQVFKENARLSGVGGSTANWSLFGALLQPLFEGKRLLNTSKARRVEAEASLMDLYETILSALKEVEDALGYEHELAIQEGSLARAVGESIKSSDYHLQRYLQGLDTIRNLLISKEQEISVKLRLNDIQAERLRNRIALALALGVGVDKFPDAGEGE
ncbi:MAG: TolC family protein [Desulfobacteraceae bacterium]|nr:TolC family protein [Desulfobacteraceae bacterium]